jgi:predicted Na+-dependent transporter
MRVKTVFQDSKILFPSAIVLGFLFPSFSEFSKPFLLCLLVLMMFVSTFELNLRELGKIKTSVTKILMNLTMNYGVLTCGIILLARVFVKDSDLQLGFVLMACMPPALIIVPLSRLLRIDITPVMLSMIIMYFASMAIPALVLNSVLPGKSLQTVDFVRVLLIAIWFPLLLSSLLSKVTFFQKTKRYHDAVLRGLVFIILYSLIGMNRAALLKDPGELTAVCGICFARTFLIGFLIFLLCTLLDVGRENSISYSLFGSYKNLSLAAVVAFVSFNERAAIPSIVCTIFEVLFVPVFMTLADLRRRRWGN